MSQIMLPELSLVVLIGVTGSGKSTFAARHFLPTEVISSDFCRGLVSDDENDQSATGDAFDVLHYIAAKRLGAGRLTVVDATNVQPEARRPLIALARAQHVLAVAIVLNVPERACAARNAGRPDRAFGPHVLRQQSAQLRRSLRGLRREGFHRVIELDGEAQIEAASFGREPLWNNKKDLHGPFDIIGDVHGCHAELIRLLTRLGYQVTADGSSASHPAGRTAVFVGDLVDRGPATPAVLRLVLSMTEAGSALCVAGNHEVKLVRALRGRNVTTGHGLTQSLAQLAAEPDGFAEQAASFMDGLLAHLVLDDGRLVVAHAGLPAVMHGRASAAVRSFALYGDTTGETDEYGLPVRYPWARDYRGSAMVVYGHTPVPEAEWVNGTICVDTGCVFGGKLTALRYPERELVSEPAAEMYYEPARPLAEPATAATNCRNSSELALTDVSGKRIISTRLTGGSVTVREENAIAALEVMSRFAVDPRWLIYLPPTMSPTTTASQPGVLEHPQDAFDAYRAAGVAELVCQEKHMGSRAVLIACREPEVARARFGLDEPAAGVIYTRTGRAFFAGQATGRELLDRVSTAIGAAGLWDALDTDWLALDCELLPWSAKATELLRTQYAPVGAAAGAALAAADALVGAAARAGADVGELRARTQARLAMAGQFRDAYRRYCWPVGSVADLKLAPFQVLASAGKVHALRPHGWHLEMADLLAAADPHTFRRTSRIGVLTGELASEAAATIWWEALTEAGGEGMVVKPASTVSTTEARLAQPGIKCRGPEYLRIIYGPEYSAEANLARLRTRSVGHKRALALREYALGIEALERFAAAEPLHRVHECVFGVLALECEPVDPRL